MLGKAVSNLKVRCSTHSFLLPSAWNKDTKNREDAKEKHLGLICFYEAKFFRMQLTHCSRNCSKNVSMRCSATVKLEFFSTK